MRYLLFTIFLSLSGSAKEVVTCQFKGQLCNQMFEVAAAYAYARDHGCEFSIPSIFGAFNGELNHRYIFHRFNVEPFPEETEFTLYEHDKITDSHIYLPIPHFPNQNLRIDGHCVSEKYFSQYEEEIRALFAPTEEIEAEIRAKYGEILKEKTVAIHVRTYIPDNFATICHTPHHLQWAKWHYFKSAIYRFPADCHFLVFSDDIQWTKKNFPPLDRKITFIEGNPHYFDFYFISLCDHQIVSPDSTFSWWAAWLNKNPNKVVIAPDRWWNMDYTDTIPEKWTKIRRYP